MMAELIAEWYKNLFGDDLLIGLANSLNIAALTTDQGGEIKWLTPKSKDLLNIDVGENILKNFKEHILGQGNVVNEVVESDRLRKNFFVIRKDYNGEILFIFEPIFQSEQSELRTKVISAPYSFDDIVGLEEVKTKSRRLALQGVNLLLVGESGTGKELLASAIHNASARAGERFVVVNCAAIPENLFESELFGYKRGAFTDVRYDKMGKIEYANNGTLFFDEIAELPPNVQAKLLRVLEDKKVIPLGGNEGRVVNVRFIFATNRNLKALVEKGKFREDLYYRIHAPYIKIPPLRERKDEIPVLIEHLLLKLKQKYQGCISGLTEPAKNALLEFDLPGNVRQLEKMLEQAFLTCQKEYIDTKDLGLSSVKPISMEEKVQQYKAKLIYERFVASGKDIKKTCSELGLSERQIYRYLKIIKINNQD
jgi:transcriptional regulator with PAS, ATPase and Fis domain